MKANCNFAKVTIIYFFPLDEINHIANNAIVRDRLVVHVI